MNANARIIEKDIAGDIAIDEAGASEVIDLSSASKFSCQAIYTVDTPVGAFVTFQGSNNGINFTNLESAHTISGDGSIMFEQANVSYRYFRALKTLGSGDVDLKCLILVIGDSI